MSNSSLVSYTKISPNKSSPRNHAIDKITVHHMAGNFSVEACGNGFAQASRQASANYGIGTDGRIALYVDEKDRSWCSGSPDNDHRAVTIEVANSGGSPTWPVSDKAYAALIDLCVDICQRNGIAKLNWTGNADGNLTVHRFFQATLCPGPYLFERMPKFADEVNARLSKKEENDMVLPLLSKGAEGPTVKAMQALLIANGCDCGPSGIDGHFGDDTDKALRQYQKQVYLGQDGKCGPKTWGKLLGVS